MNNERTKMNNERLIEAKKLLLQMADSLDDVIENNTSMSSACKKKNLNYINVRRVLLTSAFSHCSLNESLESLSDVVDLELDGYEQLYMEVFKLNDISEIKLPPDYKESADYVLTQLPERTKKIVKLHFGINNENPPMSYAEIGRLLDFSGNRIREICEEGIRKLRRHFCKEILIDGIILTNAKGNLIEEKDIAYEKSIEEWYNEQCKKIKEATANSKEVIEEGMKIMELEELALSDRAYDCLEKRGISNLYELSRMTEYELLRMRNLDDESRKEIIDKLSLLGVNLRQSKFNNIEEYDKLINIDRLDLSVRSYNCLKNAGIENFYQLSQMREIDLMKIRNLGKKSRREIIDKLAEFNIIIKAS